MLVDNVRIQYSGLTRTQSAGRINGTDGHIVVLRPWYVCAKYLHHSRSWPRTTSKRPWAWAWFVPRENTINPSNREWYVRVRLRSKIEINLICVRTRPTRSTCCTQYCIYFYHTETYTETLTRYYYTQCLNIDTGKSVDFHFQQI